METIALPKIPLTLAERAAGHVFLRVEATWDEYVELLDEVDYPIFYLNQSIISIMGQASIPHEVLVSTLTYLLNRHYFDLSDYAVMGSNVLIYVEELQEAFNADITVLQGEPDSRDLPGRYSPKTTLKNPVMVVEVLSPSTAHFDQNEKLASYIHIPSLRHILFVHQGRLLIHAYSRTEKPGQWLDSWFESLDDVITLDGLTLSVREIYHKTLFASPQ
jgi:Uma2 family endonuclease